MNKFKYKIREYNKKEKFIDVDYDDGTWARIAFMGSIPNNQSELDTLISKFTKPVEQMTVKELDDSFIEESVGKEIEATRFSFLSQEETPASSINPYQDSLDDLDNDILEETVLKILIKKGIISE